MAVGQRVLPFGPFDLADPKLVDAFKKKKKRHIVKFKVSQNRGSTFRVLKQGNIISSRKSYTFPNPLKCATLPWQKLSLWLQGTKWPWIQKFPMEAGFCPTHQTGQSKKWSIIAENEILGSKPKHGQRCKCEAQRGGHFTHCDLISNKLMEKEESLVWFTEGLSHDLERGSLHGQSQKWTLATMHPYSGMVLKMKSIRWNSPSGQIFGQGTWSCLCGKRSVLMLNVHGLNK